MQAASASPHTNCEQYDLLEVVYKGNEGKCFIIFTYRNTEVNISRDLPISDCGPVNCANHVRLSNAARMPIRNHFPQRQHLWASIKETF